MSEFQPDIAMVELPSGEPESSSPDEAEGGARCYRPDPGHPERLLRVDADEVAEAAADLTATAMHGAFRAFVLDPHYPCVGARSAVHNNSYRLGVYDALGSPTATAALARDLAAFTADLGTHPSCYENLRGPLAAFGVAADSIGSTFNIFMDVRFDPATGKMTIAPPASVAGDCIELRAEIDMIVGLTACSSEVTNAGSLKPIDFEIVAG